VENAVRNVGISLGGLNGGLAEEGLDHPEVYSRFSKRWGSKRVAPGVGRCFFLDRAGLGCDLF